MRPAPLSQYPVRDGDRVLDVLVGRYSSLGLGGTTLETIRFAAANHLCVALDYEDQQGNRSTRTIEPYSLRQTAAGEILLHAVRVDAGGHRTYRADRIRGVQVTARTFSPQHAIELTPGRVGVIRVSQRAPSATPARPKRSRTRRGTRSGPVHVNECAYCQKRFRRQKRNSRLKPHKDKTGYPCPGRSAVFLGTTYWPISGTDPVQSTVLELR